MRVIKINIDELWRRQIELADGFAAAARRGLMSGAKRALPMLQKKTAEVGAFNTGMAQKGWIAEERPPDAVAITNRQTYAGVIEFGRRPGSRVPPIKAIAKWAQRKLGLTEEEAKQAAYPIAKSIARKGIEGRPIVGPLVPAIAKMIAEEINFEIRRMLEGGGGDL